MALQYIPGATVNLGPQQGTYAPGYQYNPTQQQFSNNATIAPMQAGNAVQNKFAAGYNALNPRLNYTVDAFNNAAQTNAPLAEQMLAHGGQQFGNAIMQQNGWNQQQLNDWINQVAYEGQPGQARDNSAATQMGFGATMGDQTPGSMAGSSTYGSGQPPTTIGSLASGAGGGAANPSGGAGAPIPGTQPNYPLDINSYLNPMMQYALKQGTDTINNSAAAAGNLNSGNTMKELMQFGTGMASQNYNNAAQIAAGQQAFGYGVDNNDRNFAYNAQNNDRQFDLSALLGMGNLGLQGAGQQGLNDRLLATILSQNAGAAGQLQAGGTLGTNSIIQQIIRNLTTQGSTPRAG